MMLRRLGSVVFKIKTQQFQGKLWTCAPKTYCTATVNNTKIDEKVLNIINTKNETELQGYGIAAANAKKIINHRNGNGPYKSVEDIFVTHKFRMKSLEKFFNSIYEHENEKHDIFLLKTRISSIAQKNKSSEVAAKDKTSWITPRIPSDLQHINTILGIHFGKNIITWALLNTDYEILDWNSNDLPTEYPLGRNYQNMQKILNVISQLPESDVYVIEEEKVPRKSNGRVSCHQRQLVTLAIMTGLAVKSGSFSSSKNNVFTLKPEVSAQYFNLIVGSEIVSTEYIVPVLLGRAVEKVHIDDLGLPHLRMGPETQCLYEHKNKIGKELMNWSLLKAVVFLRIISQNNENSTAESAIG